VPGGPACQWLPLPFLSPQPDPTPSVTRDARQRRRARVCSPSSPVHHLDRPPPLLHVPLGWTPSHFPSPARVLHGMGSCRDPTHCCRSSSCSPPLQSSPMMSLPLRPSESATWCQILPIRRRFLPRSMSAQRFAKFLQSMNYSPPTCSLCDAEVGRGRRQSPERLTAIETSPHRLSSPPPCHPAIMVSSRLPDHARCFPLFILEVYPPEPPHSVAHLAGDDRATAWR
jgi:hypothetical protein